MRFLMAWFATAIATFFALWIVPGISVVGGAYAGPILTALILSFLNATLKPFMKLISLPITIFTFGLFSLVLNAFVLEIASGLTQSLFDQGLSISSFGSAFMGAIIISIVSTIMENLLN